eukprot:CAMPEP_0202412272 /NCGR_PEP_ID=MMETSP1128-20130828/25045_1 /ASSEMBLY_ACC=CAM_ASM_000463 /TAXON_ID=3047 /ORGANISM="Dunaliella tertiolecta, Strain CCMP1320" /LENGTH=330 /DNA_ID=CAMNT_0049018153 /DNA_START=1194 /DNA_END=2188 /DNA_ORIENTATION=+
MGHLPLCAWPGFAPAGPAAAAIAAHGAHPPRHAPPLAVLAAAAAAKGNSAAAAAGAAAAAPVHLQAVLSSPAESAGCAPRRQAVQLPPLAWPREALEGWALPAPPHKLLMGGACAPPGVVLLLGSCSFWGRVLLGLCSYITPSFPLAPSGLVQLLDACCSWASAPSGLLRLLLVQRLQHGRGRRLVVLRLQDLEQAVVLFARDIPQPLLYELLLRRSLLHIPCVLLGPLAAIAPSATAAPHPTSGSAAWSPRPTSTPLPRVAVPPAFTVACLPRRLVLVGKPLGGGTGTGTSCNSTPRGSLRHREYHCFSAAPTSAAISCFSSVFGNARP